MVLDFADRQVVVATFPALHDEWGLSDAQLGALVSVVSVTVGIGAFPAALLVDRWSRVRAIALMGTVWSLAAAAAGAAQSSANSSPPAPLSASARRATVRPPARSWQPGSHRPAGRRSSERSRRRRRWVGRWGCSSAA